MEKNPILKLILSITISFLFIYLIYKKLDFNTLRETLKNTDFVNLSVYLGLFIPQIIIASFRWQYILKNVNQYPVCFNHAFQMVVGSYSANLIIPAKMGEIVRIFWIDKSRSKFPPLLLVLFEKLWDIFSVVIIFYFAFSLLQFNDSRFRTEFVFATIIILIGFVGFILSLIFSVRNERTEIKIVKIINSLIKFWQKSRKYFPAILLWSLLLWIIQVSQFYFMFRVFNIHLPLTLAFAGGALAVLAGALIISIGGIGPRDATILWFFEALVSKEILVSVGILSALRIVIPALVGLPFFTRLSIIQKYGKTSLEPDTKTE